MGNRPLTPHQEELYRAEIETLRANRIGTLIHIIDGLAAMELTATEIDTVLMISGLNRQCAIKEGATIKANREYEKFQILAKQL